MFLNGLSQTAHKNMARAPHRMAKTFRSHVTLRSNVLLPVKKQPPAKSSAISHKLLERAGFIKQSAAGVYTFLPLGLEVLNRIESVVDIEMQKIGAQKVQMPLLLSADLWKTTGRWKSTGRELFRLQDRKVSKDVFFAFDSYFLTNFLHRIMIFALDLHTKKL